MAKSKKSRKAKKRGSAKAVPAPQKSRRQYAAAKAGRLMYAAATTSADHELYTSLETMRANSRRLVRDNPFANRAKQVVINNVIGAGVGLQAQVKMTRGGRLAKSINEAIEVAHATWSRAENCHVAGALHLHDIERLLMGEVFEAGEMLIRLHRGQAFGAQGVPFAIELIEAERIADDHEIVSPVGARVTMGIEHDKYGRTLAVYVHSADRNALRGGWARDPGRVTRIPADELIHLKLVERWPQARGVPMMHAAVTRLHQLGEFEEAAVIAARIGASKVGFFEQSEISEQGDLGDGEEADGTASTTVEPGEFTELPQGYKFASWDPNYPSDTFDPFMRAALRGIAAACGVSYEALSRDYSQSNYSSSRLALLDDRDQWRVLQEWWIRSFREPLYRAWLQQAVFADVVDGVSSSLYMASLDRIESVRWKPRGWSWVDPAKEVKAYKEAEKAGYVTKGDVIAATAGGADLQDTIEARERELQMLADANIDTDTAPLPRDESLPNDSQDAADSTNGAPSGADDAAPLRAVGDD